MHPPPLSPIFPPLSPLSSPTTSPTLAFSFSAMHISALCVPTELLDFKFRLMKWKGYKLMEPPINAKSNFLRDLPIPQEAEYS